MRGIIWRSVAAIAYILMPMAFLGHTGSLAQPDTLWARTYGTNGREYCYDMSRTSDGGFLLGGESRPAGSQIPLPWIVKLNAVGDTLWTRLFDEFEYGAIRFVGESTDSRLLAAMDAPTDSGSIQLIKLNTDGSTSWFRTYATGMIRDCIQGGTVTLDGGCILVGWSNLGGSTEDDYLIFRIDSNGNEMWHRIIETSPNRDIAQSVTTTPDGCFVICGTNFGGQSSYIKLDSQGSTIWTRRITTSLSNSLLGIIAATDNGFALTGTQPSTVGNRVLLAKTDSSGFLQWSHIYGGDLHVDQGDDLQELSDQGFIIAGYTRSFGINTPDYSNVFIIRTDSSGDSLWSRYYGGELADRALSIESMADGGFAVAGRTSSFGAGQSDFYFLRLDSENTATAQFENLLTDDYEMSAYPNPFNSETTIEFTIHRPGQVELTVYNVAGQKVGDVVNRYLGTGRHRVRVDGTKLGSGSYYSSINQEGQSTFTRIMLIR